MIATLFYISIQPHFIWFVVDNCFLRRNDKLAITLSLPIKPVNKLSNGSWPEYWASGIFPFSRRLSWIRLTGLKRSLHEYDGASVHRVIGVQKIALHTADCCLPCFPSQVKNKSASMQGTSRLGRTNVHECSGNRWHELVQRGAWPHVCLHFLALRASTKRRRALP